MIIDTKSNDRTYRTQAGYESYMSRVTSELELALERHDSLMVDASDFNAVKVTAFSQSGVGTICTSIVSAIQHPRQFALTVFHGLSTGSEQVMLNLRVSGQTCFGKTQAGLHWTAKFMAVDEGYYLQIEKRTEVELTDFINSEIERIKNFGKYYTDNASQDNLPMERPITGRYSWKHQLAKFSG